jgi:hypothetical protein
VPIILIWNHHYYLLLFRVMGATEHSPEPLMLLQPFHYHFLGSESLMLLQVSHCNCFGSTDSLCELFLHDFCFHTCIFSSQLFQHHYLFFFCCLQLINPLPAHNFCRCIPERLQYDIISIDAYCSNIYFNWFYVSGYFAQTSG